MGKQQCRASDAEAVRNSVGKADNEHNETRKADWIGRWMAVLLLLFTIGTFYYMNLWPGKLTFAKPNAYEIRYVGRGEKPPKTRLGAKPPITGCGLITIPVSVTNSGAIVHTVNFLRGQLISEDGKLSETFYMCYEPDALSTGKLTLSRYATSFAVGPRSSCTRLISFRSQRWGLSIPVGKYHFTLHDAWVDGRSGPVRTDMVFPVAVTPLVHQLIESGKQGCINFGLYLRE